MKRLFLILALLVSPAIAQVSVTATATSTYGNQVIPNSSRQVGYQILNGTANKLNFSLTGSSTGVTLDCTSNCSPTVKVTMPSTAPTCSVSGTVGFYSISGGTIFNLIGTSVDDPTKSATVTFQVCDVSSDAFANVEPYYDQLYPGQQSTLQSYVGGYINQNVTWAITSQPGGGDGALADNTNRDTVFTATVPGTYVITATSVANGSLVATAKRYVTHQTAPSYAATPNHTAPVACEADPSMTSTIYHVGPSQAHHDFTTVPLTSAFSMVIVHNEGTPGSPTVIPAVFEIKGAGSAAQPRRICGIPISNGELPVLQGSGAVENTSDDPGLTNGGVLFFNGNSGTMWVNGPIGPNYVSIGGIHFRQYNVGYTYTLPSGSTHTWNGSDAPSAFWAFSGQDHLLFIGNEIEDTMNGALMKSTPSANAGGGTVANGQLFSAWQQVIGNYIHHFSVPGSFGTHGLYLQALHTIVDGNLFADPQSDCSGLPTSDCIYDNGDFIKMRGGDSIIRNNIFRDILTGHVLEYPSMSDTWQFMSLDENLGVPGDTTVAHSGWASVPTGNITLNQLLMNAEAMQKDYAYGNVLSNAGGILTFDSIQYGSYASTNPSECPAGWSPIPCTPNMDHNGTYYFWNNTVDQPINGVWQTSNNSTTISATPQYFATAQWLQNNIVWNDAAHNVPGVNPFYLNMDTTMIATFTTNLFQTGLVTCTGTITGGTTQGWGAYNTNNYAFGPSNPMTTLTGLGGTNCLTTSGIPYNRATYAPQSGSAAIGAGASVTNTFINHLPVRYQPDALNGWVVPRTSPTDIGAVGHSATQPTISGIAITPSSYTLPAAGPTLWYKAVTTFSNGLTENCTFRCYWDTSNPSVLFTFYNIRNQYGTGTSGSANATAAEDSTMQTSALTIGSFVADPIFTPAAGIYTSTQSVTITSTTGGATICWTNDGSTPAATTPGTCSHGTTYSGAISVPSTITLKALATLASSTNSNVITAAYTINPPTVANPTFTPGPGTYVTNQNVTIATTTSGSTLCYTVDGSTPTASSGTCTHGTTYSTPVNISATTTLKAIGSKSGDVNSGVVSGLYTITGTTIQITIGGKVIFSGSVK